MKPKTKKYNIHMKKITLQKLVEIYEGFKMEPLKTFVLKDFNANFPDEGIFFKTLIKLGLIESVHAETYYHRRDIIGYRLIRSKK